MSSPTLRLPGSVAEIAGSPEGPTVAACFDLDGTLIAGYSVKFLGQERMRQRDFSISELVRTLGVSLGAGLGRAGFEDLIALGAAAWKGRAQEDLDEMGERIFRKRIARLIYPEMRELVRAHQRRGHVVILSSSATSYQVEPVARSLGIDHVLCNRFEAKDGLLTGDVERPVIWGSTKADVVQKLADDLGVDLTASYFYADGDEDLALMHLVGHPRPTNPGKRLAKVAAKRGWPVLRFTSRGGSDVGNGFKAAATMGSLVPCLALGVAKGIVKRDKTEVMPTVATTWINFTFALNGVKVNVTGRENLWAERPAVFIFNHRNNFDAFIVVRLVEQKFTGVAKKEMANNPITIWLGKLADVAFVDRADSAGAVGALKGVEDAAKKGLSILIAPEGSRLDTTDDVGPFKKGAFRMAMAAEIPIVPIVIRNAETIAHTKGNSLHPGTVDVTVLPPISVADWTRENIDERIEEVRGLFRATLQNWPG
jgi:putative phosphoserine phosphatase/1-acylglycerol-3-phosphate O-acyltransferase